MSTPELDRVLASVDAAVRRAYAMGRKDALDQLVDYARSDEVASPPLALTAPEQIPEPEAEALVGANDQGRREDVPMTPGVSSSLGLGGLIRDFVFPAKAS